jgi:hypothetical protein
MTNPNPRLRRGLGQACRSDLFGTPDKYPAAGRCRNTRTHFNGAAMTLRPPPGARHGFGLSTSGIGRHLADVKVRTFDVRFQGMNGLGPIGARLIQAGLFLG